MIDRYANKGEYSVHIIFIVKERYFGSARDGIANLFLLEREDLIKVQASNIEMVTTMLL